MNLFLFFSAKGPKFNLHEPIFSLYRQFPARTPMGKTLDYWDLQYHVENVQPGLGRSALSQGAHQIAALGTTLAFAIVGGLITGNMEMSFM